MIWLGDRRTGFGHKGIGLGLQVPAAALLDFCGTFCQPGEEGIDLLAHFGGVAEAGSPSRLRESRPRWLRLG